MTAGREPGSSPSRRSVLAGGLGALALPALAACSGSSSPAQSAASDVASPRNPKLWPIAPGNPPIADGLAPEVGATLRLFNYADYVDPGAMSSFQRKYGVKVEVVTFDDSLTALNKIIAGQADHDIYFPSYDQLGKLITGGFLKPLTHSYIPNIAQVWPEFSDPFYDKQWRYSVPYTVYNTGVAWRTDMVPENLGRRADPYSVFWDPRYSGRMSVLDDYRTLMGMVLLRYGRSLNTTSEADLDFVRGQLLDMVRRTHPKALVTDYTDLPEGKFPIVQAWSGDVVNALNSLPSGVDPSVLRYWTPSDSSHQSDNDMMVILGTARSPVAAHLFLNHMLDYPVALKNFSAIGYQMPQSRITPESLILGGALPQTLSNATVRPEFFATGGRILELPEDADKRWQAVWSQFKALA